MARVLITGGAGYVGSYCAKALAAAGHDGIVFNNLTFGPRECYFNAAGADPTGEIGEDHEPEAHLIPLVLDTALGRKASMQIYGTDYPTPDGTAIRDYVHVVDLARAHVLSLEYGGDTIAINLGSGRGTSVREVIDTARAVTGIAKERSELSIIIADAWRWHAQRFGEQTV